MLRVTNNKDNWDNLICSGKRDMVAKDIDEGRTMRTGNEERKKSEVHVHSKQFTLLNHGNTRQQRDRNHHSLSLLNSKNQK